MNELVMDAEAMRRIGYAVVDRLVEWRAGLSSRPAWRAMPPDFPSFPEPPASGAGVDGFDALLDTLFDTVIPAGARTDHPRFFAFVPGSGTWPSALGDFIAAGTGVFQGTWLASAGVSRIELDILRWFCNWLGLPQEAGGLLTSGGSVANMTALACARQLRFGADWQRACFYLSAETHSSIARAARVLGFSPEQVRIVPADAEQRMDVAALEAMMFSDMKEGRAPFLVVANAGTTSTGSVDSLLDIAGLCRRHDLWMHVDAAYGGFAAITGRGRTLLAGIEHADSVTLDPHKWLYQPFEAGCLLTRDASALRRAFHVMPDYLRDTALAPETDHVNFAERGIQLTRYARAIKIWLSIHYFGLDAFRRAIDHCLDLASYAEEFIRASGSMEIVTPARLGIVCFSRKSNGCSAEEVERVNGQLIDQLRESGIGLISSTRVNGVFALRLCILSLHTTQDDVRKVLEFLERSELDRV